MRSTYFILLCVAVAASGSKVNTADCSKETDTDRKNLCDMCVANPVKADFIPALMTDAKLGAAYETDAKAGAAFDTYCPAAGAAPAAGGDAKPVETTNPDTAAPKAGDRLVE